METNLPRRRQFIANGALTIALILILSASYPAQSQQQGISVELARTLNANPMPDADKDDATIVTVTQDGRIFFGLNPAGPSDVTAGVSSRKFSAEHRLYIKADRRTPYATVKSVLAACRAANLEEAVLITSQIEQSGSHVPPRGLDVRLDPGKSSQDTPVVRIRRTTRATPALYLNNQMISQGNLSVPLRGLVAAQKNPLVVVKDEGLLSYSQMVDIMDICQATGAKIVLTTEK